MKRLIFVDSASIHDIKKWKKRGLCDGVTTNQKILLNEKNIDLKKTIIQICKVCKAPVSVELTGHKSLKEMVIEAKVYTKWHKNIIVKVPMTVDGLGLEVLYVLNYLKIKTNVTLMVSFEQMLLAVKAGATFASIFFNRAKDSGYDPVRIIQRTRQFIDTGGFKTAIITGSIRNKRDVGEAFAAGSDIVTIPPKILDAMVYEETTLKTTEEFDLAWKEFEKK